MDTREVDRILETTLHDGKLSRSERKALGKVFGDLRPDHRMRAVYRQRAFRAAQKALKRRADREVLEWLEEVTKIIAPKPSEVRAAAAVSDSAFSPNDNIPRLIEKLFDGARRSVDICVFTITDDRVTRAIQRAHRRRVAIRIISDDEKAWDRGSDIDRLRRAGIPTKVDQDEDHMHHKFAIFDRKRLLNGSYNWTRSAAEHNRENVIVTEDPGLLASFQGEFDKLWMRF